MVIRMTRDEYEKKYGVTPIFGASQSKVDTTPSPTQMTRAEYTVRYGVDPFTNKPLDNRGVVGKIFTPAKESLQGLGQLYGGGEQGIANKIKTNIQTGANEYANSPMGFKQLTSLAKTGFRVAGDVVNTIYAPISAVIGATGVGKASEYFGQWYVDKFGQDLTDNPVFQRFAIEHPNAGEDFNRALAIATSAFDTGKIEPSTVIPRTQAQFAQLKADIATRLPKVRSAVDKTVDEIGNIENNYAKTRKAELYSKDSVASRERIAKSGVLEGAADTNGLIRTKQKGGAAEQYRKLTIDGAEDVVRINLTKEGKIVNLKDVAKQLTDDVMNSGLEGADLKAALTGVTREVQGLMVRADAKGNILLDKIHDAKINTTKNINFNTPPETATYRKSVARTYKKIVEKTSDLPIEAVNMELGKYLGDIKRLENLDGLRVRGGKLGRYTAQITGNIAGGAIGGAVGGGFAGMALGTVLGGEIASIIKGRSMSGTFGQVKTPEIMKSPLLEQAKSPTGLIPSKSDSTGRINTPQKEVQVLSSPKPTTVPENVQKSVSAIKDYKKMLDDPKSDATTVGFAKRGIEGETNYLNKKGYYQTINEGGVIKAVEGELVKIVDGIKTFLHKDENGNWAVSEVTTGRNLTGGGFENKTFAIKVARENINDAGIAKTKKLIESNKLPTTESALLQEAKKYKSAEEFVKAQENIPVSDVAFHGSQAKEIRGVPNKTKGTMGNAFYLADSADEALKFGTDKGVTIGGNKMRVSGAYQKANKFTFDLSNLKIKKFKNDAEFFDYVKDPDIEKWFRLAGYDGVYITKNGNYAIYNTEKLRQILPESQLTDIWNKANKK